MRAPRHLPFVHAILIAACVPTTPSQPVESFARAAVVNPTLSSEIAFDPPVSVAASGYQQLPAVAFGGGVLLVVWDSSSESGNRDIWGTRIRPDGTRMDPTGFPIAVGVPNQYAPAVDFDGANFLVVWNDERVSPAGIYGARVTPAGAVIDANGIMISTRTGNAGPLAIAFDGTNHLVATQMGTDARALRVSTAGVAQGNMIDFGPGENPVVGWNGSNHLVAYRRTNTQANTFELFARIVTPQGAFGGAEFSVGTSTTAAGLGKPQAVASNGSEWLVLYDASGSVRGRRVSGAGALQGSLLTYTAGAINKISALFSGGAYYLFSDGGAATLQGTRVDASGAVTAGPTAFTSPYAMRPAFPAAASDGTNLYVTFSDSAAFPAYDDVFGRRVSPALAAVDEPAPLLSQTANRQQELAAAFNGTSYLVVWNDVRGALAQVYGARIAQNGTVLDSAGFAITQSTTTIAHPAVASNGTDWLVVWESQGAVRASRVTAAGASMDPTGIAVATGTTHRNPAVASNGTDYFVVWTDGNVPTVRGARVRANGTTPDGAAGLVIHKAASSDFPSLAWNGTSYLVASASGGVVASRVSAAAILLDAADVALGASALYPAVASDGSGWLVTWWTNSASASEIRAARVAAAGTVVDTTTLLVSASGLERPAVSWDGAAYWIGWTDWRNVGGRLVDYAQNADLYVGTVRPDGTRPAPAETVIAQSAGFEGFPAVAAGSYGLLVAYTRLDYAAGYAARRARVRLLNGTPPPDAGPGDTGGGTDAGRADTAGGTGGATGTDASRPDSATGGTGAGGDAGAPPDAAGGSTGTDGGAGGASGSTDGPTTGGDAGGADRPATGGSGGGGCGCRIADPTGAAPALVLLLLALAAKRRR